MSDDSRDHVVTLVENALLRLDKSQTHNMNPAALGDLARALVDNNEVKLTRLRGVSGVRPSTNEGWGDYLLYCKSRSGGHRHRSLSWAFEPGEPVENLRATNPKRDLSGLSASELLAYANADPKLSNHNKVGVAVQKAAAS